MIWSLFFLPILPPVLQLPKRNEFDRKTRHVCSPEPGCPSYHCFLEHPAMTCWKGRHKWNKPTIFQNSTQKWTLVLKKICGCKNMLVFTKPRPPRPRCKTPTFLLQQRQVFPLKGSYLNQQAGFCGRVFGMKQSVWCAVLHIFNIFSVFWGCQNTHRHTRNDKGFPAIHMMSWPMSSPDGWLLPSPKALG